jgi:hypothetical protein
MAKDVTEKTYAELSQDLQTNPTSLLHLTAKAEMGRRAAVLAVRNSWLMLASALIAMAAAFASAASAYYSSQRANDCVPAAHAESWPAPSPPTRTPQQ